MFWAVPHCLKEWQVGPDLFLLKPAIHGVQYERIALSFLNFSGITLKCDKNKPARFSIVYCIKFFSKMEKKYLHNGCTIPAIGLGTWQVPPFCFLAYLFIV